jgi:hypothetical protein
MFATVRTVFGMSSMAAADSAVTAPAVGSGHCAEQDQRTEGSI